MTHTPDIDIVASEVSDQQAGIAEPSPEEAKARRYATMQRGVAKLNEIAEMLMMVERAMGQMLPDVINEQPLGDAVDLTAEFHLAIKALTNDGEGGGAIEKVKRRLAFVKEVTMPERMDEEKVTTFNTDRFRVTRTGKTYASIIKTEEERAFDWLRNHDLGGLIKPTVNASSLSAAAKEAIENGRELPDDLFRTHFQNSISVTVKRQ